MERFNSQTSGHGQELVGITPTRTAEVVVFDSDLEGTESPDSANAAGKGYTIVSKYGQGEGGPKNASNAVEGNAQASTLDGSTESASTPKRVSSTEQSGSGTPDSVTATDGHGTDPEQQDDDIATPVDTNTNNNNNPGNVPTASSAEVVYGGEGGNKGSGSPDSAPTPGGIVSADSAKSPDTSPSPGSPDSPDSPYSATPSAGNPENNPSTPNSNPDDATENNKAPQNLESRKLDKPMQDLLEDNKVASLVALVNSVSKTEANEAQRKSVLDRLKAEYDAMKDRINSDIASTDDNSDSAEINKLEDKRDAMLRFSERAEFALDNGFEITDQILVLTPDELKEQRTVGSDLERERLELEERQKQYKQKRQAFEESLGQAPTKPGEEGSESAGDNVEVDKSKPYFKALEEYAAMKADRELRGKGGRFMNWVRRVTGKEKREDEKFYELEDQLKEKALAYVVETTAAKRRNGEYAGTEDEIEQKMSDDTFDMLREILDKEVREQTDLELEKKIDGSLYKRFTAKIGSWVSMDKSKKGRFKAGAAGFLTGGLRGLAVGLLGAAANVGLPVTAVVGAGAAVVGGRMLRKGVEVDETRKRLGSDPGGVLSKEKSNEVKKFIHDSETLKNSDEAKKKEYMADSILKLTRDTRKEKLANAVDERLKNNRVPLAIGRIAGGAIGGAFGNMLGNWTHGWFGGDTTQAASVPPDPDTKAPDPNIERQIGSGVNEIAKANTIDFSQYEYPWDAAADLFGAENATAKLQELTEAAMRNGYNVEWHGSGTEAWISVDGVSDTEYVMKILGQYV